MRAGGGHTVATRRGTVWYVDERRAMAGRTANKTKRTIESMDGTRDGRASRAERRDHVGRDAGGRGQL